MAHIPVVAVTANPSGAVKAAGRGDVILVVDVIDMSTTLESVLEAGAVRVFGACPDGVVVPVPVNPKRVGSAAGEAALAAGGDVVLIGEPRTASVEEIMRSCGSVLQGIEDSGASVAAFLPNLGAETAHLRDFAGSVAVAVTKSGGVVFDAAFNCGAEVLTATIARTLGTKGPDVIIRVVRRACDLAASQRKDITVVAASGTAVEDVLAAEHIANCIIREGFLETKI